MYEAWVEVVALGMRSLAPHAFLPIQNPYLSFEVAGAGQAPVHTNRSKRPSGRDPNFLQVGGPPLSSSNCAVMYMSCSTH